MNDEVRDSDLASAEDAQGAQTTDRPSGSSSPATLPGFHLRRLNEGSEHWSLSKRRKNRPNFQRASFPITLNTNAAQRVWADSYGPFCAAFLKALAHVERARLNEHKAALSECVDRIVAAVEVELQEVRSQLELIVQSSFGHRPVVEYAEAATLEVQISHPSQAKYMNLIRTLDEAVQTIELSVNLGLVEPAKGAGRERFVVRRVRGVKERTRVLQLKLLRHTEDEPVDLLALKAELGLKEPSAPAPEASAEPPAMLDPWKE